MFSKAKSKDQSVKKADAKSDVNSVGANQETVKKASNGKTSPRARSARPGGVPSIISADMIIRGAIESGGEVQFDGEIEGDIRAKGLVVGDGAKVTGEVVAEKVRVCGTVEGAIRGIEVELASSALVKGDIAHTSLSIESGARFEGNCRHTDDPVGDGGKRKKATPRPSPIPPKPPTSADANPAEPQHQQMDASPNASLPELMPQRQEPAADRSFVKQPAGTSVNLR
ncbi:MAG: polymer-forming cytoskeletal protein [Pseudomonadota bacterium]